MSRRGQVFENPVTGERAVIITDPLDHPQGVLVAELHVEPGGRVAGAHRHPGVIERFQVVRGTVNYLIDGREVTLGPALSARAYSDTMVMESPPHWVQRIAFGVLGPIARARGLKPTYPEYLVSSVVVEPDPEALALVGADGRLLLPTASATRTRSRS